MGGGISAVDRKSCGDWSRFEISVSAVYFGWAHTFSKCAPFPNSFEKSAGSLSSVAAVVRLHGSVRMNVAVDTTCFVSYDISFWCSTTCYRRS